MATSLTGTLTVIPIPGHGAEDVLVDDQGWVYTGTEDGSVFRVRSDGTDVERVGNRHPAGEQRPQPGPDPAPVVEGVPDRAWG